MTTNKRRSDYSIAEIFDDDLQYFRGRHGMAALCNYGWQSDLADLLMCDHWFAA
jgi:hypothetical protein